MFLFSRRRSFFIRKTARFPCRRLIQSRIRAKMKSFAANARRDSAGFRRKRWSRYRSFSLLLSASPRSLPDGFVSTGYAGILTQNRRLPPLRLPLARRADTFLRSRLARCRFRDLLHAQSARQSHAHTPQNSGKSCCYDAGVCFRQQAFPSDRILPCPASLGSSREKALLRLPLARRADAFLRGRLARHRFRDLLRARFR